MCERNRLRQDPQLDCVLRQIEQAGYSVHIRTDPLLPGGEPAPVEIYAVRSDPQPACRIVRIPPGRDRAELLAAVELAESLGVPVTVSPAALKPGESHA